MALDKEPVCKHTHMQTFSRRASKEPDMLGWCHCLWSKQTSHVSHCVSSLISACWRLRPQVTLCRELMNNLDGYISAGCPPVALFVFVSDVWYGVIEPVHRARPEVLLCECVCRSYPCCGDKVVLLTSYREAFLYFIIIITLLLSAVKRVTGKSVDDLWNCTDFWDFLLHLWLENDVSPSFQNNKKLLNL